MLRAEVERLNEKTQQLVTQLETIRKVCLMQWSVTSFIKYHQLPFDLLN